MSCFCNTWCNLSSTSSLGRHSYHLVTLYRMGVCQDREHFSSLVLDSGFACIHLEKRVYSLNRHYNEFNVLKITLIWEIFDKHFEWDNAWSVIEVQECFKCKKMRPYILYVYMITFLPTKCLWNCISVITFLPTRCLMNCISVITFLPIRCMENHIWVITFLPTRCLQNHISVLLFHLQDAWGITFL